MKIMMLGHTNVGKTTYMASMYGTLQSPINGFSLRTTHTTHHQELQTLHRNISSGRYPLPSQQRQKYDFSLLYNGQAFFPFEWIDYRGGALLERSSSSEATQLVSDLHSADGIVLFCDSDPRERKHVLRQVNRMMQFVGQSLQDREKAATIAIVFTKCDLTDGLDEGLFEPTSNLVETISKSETVVGTLIPVACGLKPINVELPVLFALCFGLLIEARLYAQQVEYYQALEQAYVNEGNTWGGIFKDIGRAWNGNPTTSQMAAQARESALERWRKIEKLIEPGEQLAEYLDELPMF